MNDVLPWILLLAVIAAAVGFFAGRRSIGTAPSAGAKGYGNEVKPAPATTSATSATSTPRGPAIPKPKPASVSRPAQPASDSLTGLLGKARSWGYQLQKLDIPRAVASEHDLLVIDYSKDGTESGALKPADVERLKRKPDGSRRVVVAYCSVGEAESYRPYWQKDWKREQPVWLLGENPEWEENYSVCFWDQGWQRIVCGEPGALVDRIIAQGFDGVYLDKCDVYEDLREHFKSVAKSRPNLEGDMVAFVRRISSYAKSKRPDFLVIMQNAEPLLERAELRRAIDASAKEELLFGLDRPEKPNARDEVEESRVLLDRMKRDGKPVFMVEYLNNQSRIDEAVTAAEKLGYVLYIAPKDRELARLNSPAG